MGDINLTIEIIPALIDMVRVWAVLFVLYLIIKKFFYKPLTDFVESRQGAIMKEIDEAKANNQASQALKEEYEEKIRRTQEERDEILSQARKRAEEIKAVSLREAKKEAENIKARANLEIEREKAKAFEDLKKETGEMAVLIAGKLINKEFKLKDQNILIDEFIDEVGSSQWKN